ncbi:MAG TPA: BamA/TamA family outer membrane protein [Bryobacteraceae bacterium]|nr:BamA/TamA family outer membrane protein [Bryobacteraceae bacterium]
MRVLLLAALFAIPGLGQVPEEPGNVNSKYIVEAVVVLPESAGKRLGSGIQSDIDAMVGQKFDPAAADRLRTRIGEQLHRKVEKSLERGDKPDHVKVVYSAPRVFDVDADVNKLAYHSKHGWTGGLQAPFEAGPLTLRVGVQSDLDTLLERYAGYTLGVSVDAGERVRARVDFGSFHNQWNATTLRALETRPDLPGIYRERYIVSPNVAIALTRALVLTAGVDIQQFQTQFPAARFEASNALTTTLRYRRRWSSNASRQEVDAGYGLRAATKSLDSDYAYARHAVAAEYNAEVGHSTVSVEFRAGRLGGTAPLFDRYTLGDSRTLRGWSKFDVAPVGGTRVAYGSLEYWYRWLGLFYDTGAVWDSKEDRGVKHSAGVAVGGSEGMFLAIAFPIRSGSVTPMFILGMNY